MALFDGHETEYTLIPNYEQILLDCENVIFIRLATQGSVDRLSICDTRSIHHEMFISLIPHFAGKYRGGSRCWLRGKIRKRAKGMSF